MSNVTCNDPYRLYNEPQPRMNLMGRLPLPEYLLRPRREGFAQRFLPDMVNIKANIKAYKNTPMGNPRKEWTHPKSISQGHLGYPGGGGGVQRQPPRRPMYDAAPGVGDIYRGRKRGQVLV